MTSSAIADVGETLITLLRNNMPDLTEQRISLLSPAEVEGNDIRLTLFLYSIIENQHLKNEDVYEKSSSEFIYPPLYLDLYFLMTAYGSEGEQNLTERSLEAHRVFGRAMRVLYDNSIIKGSILQGGLEGTKSELHITHHPISLEELNKVWSIFPNVPYRKSVSYLVTPVKIDSEREESCQRVTDKTTEYNKFGRSRLDA